MPFDKKMFSIFFNTYQYLGSNKLQFFQIDIHTCHLYLLTFFKYDHLFLIIYLFVILNQEHKLLEGRSTQQMKSMEGLNSTERRQLHADRKQLGKLRREHKNIRHKPKILKLEGEVSS